MNRQFSRDGNFIRYELSFTLNQSVISPEEYHAAKQFFDTLAKEDGTHLIIERMQGS